MTEDKMSNRNGFEIDARVMRADGTKIVGVITSVREDSQASSDRSERGVVLGVQWDNGTFSYFTPNQLIAARS